MPLRPGLFLIQGTQVRIKSRRQKAATKRLLSAFCFLLSTFYFCLPAAAHEGKADKGQKQAAPLSSSRPSSCPMSFSDVLPTDYFYQAVAYLYCHGVIGGYADGTFRPYNSTTRGQFSKMLVLAEGFPINTTAGPHFQDVPASNPFYDYVETAYNRQLISGYADGTFRPNADVNRGQFTKMLVIAEGWPLENPPTARFSDVPVGSAYFQYVETAVSRQLISGYADGTFHLGNSATRGQIAKVLYLTAYGWHLTSDEQQTIDLINQRRAGMGLGALAPNPALTIAGRWHSEDIGPADLCQHNGTDGSSPWDRIAQAGYTGTPKGEVVGCGFTTAQSVVDGWWNSPSHYAILTDPTANDIGCGWWFSSTGEGWQTCDTGRQ